MTALPVAYYLKDLSGDAQRRGRGLAPFGSQDGADVDLRVSEAHATGVAEGRAAAAAEYEAQLNAHAVAFEQRIADERARWAQEQGSQLGALIVSGLEEVERRIADNVNEILRPVLVDRIRVRAVDELARVLKGMLSKGEFAKVSISGPADLVSVLEARLAGSHSGLVFAATDAPDVTVSLDEAILATQIGAWTTAIAGGDQ